MPLGFLLIFFSLSYLIRSVAPHTSGGWGRWLQGQHWGILQQPMRLRLRRLLGHQRCPGCLPSARVCLCSGCYWPQRIHYTSTWGLSQTLVLFTFLHLLRSIFPASDPIRLDDVVCLGTEPSLANCSASDFGVTNCDHYECAGVICTSEQQLSGHSYITFQTYCKEFVFFNNLFLKKWIQFWVFMGIFSQWNLLFLVTELAWKLATLFLRFCLGGCRSGAAFAVNNSFDYSRCCHDS